MIYRREIDGLRAIAVLPVIFFHAGIESFSGGFVGVDVFFVISGYLITSIILSEKQKGTFSLVGFYERRVRRILPALYVVMLACVPVAWFFMLPKDLEEFSLSLVATSVFLSNLLLERTSGYFDTAFELKPLLHTWSLAVEEQYYVLFPLFIAAIWRAGKAVLLSTLALLFVFSLFLAQFGKNFHLLSSPHIEPVWNWWGTPTYAFFLLPTRGWEILLGALAAFYLFARSEPAPAREGRGQYILSEFASLVGLLMISYAVFVFNRTTPFPGVYALIPTGGAVLIVLFASERTFVGRLLGLRMLVGIGLISYSAYLWHQPLFAFARINSFSFSSPGKTLYLLLAAASLVLAYLTWKFVERPIRTKGSIPRNRLFLLASLIGVGFVCLGLFGYINQGFRDRFSPELLTKVYPAKTNEDVFCKWAHVVDGEDSIRACLFGDLSSRRTVALYGDSHASALFSELNGAFKAASIKGLRIRSDGGSCEIIPGIQQRSRILHPDENSLARCNSSYQKLVDYVATNADALVISIRWTMLTYPIPGEVTGSAYDNGEGGIEYFEPREYFTFNAGKFDSGAVGKRMAIETFMKSMLLLNKPTVLVYPVPEIGWHISKYNLAYYSRERKLPESISTSYDRFKARNKFTNATLDGIADDPKLSRVKPEEIFCNTFVKDRCVAQVESDPLYYDENHLSNKGARIVVDQVMRKITNGR